MIKKTSWRPLPDFLTIKESKIEGLGVFATRNLPKGFDLGISHIFDERFPDGYIRLPLGGFINHHEIPNCNAILSEQDQQMGELKHIRIQAKKSYFSGARNYHKVYYQSIGGSQLGV